MENEVVNMKQSDVISPMAGELCRYIVKHEVIPGGFLIKEESLKFDMIRKALLDMGWREVKLKESMLADISCLFLLVSEHDTVSSSVIIDQFKSPDLLVVLIESRKKTPVQCEIEELAYRSLISEGDLMVFIRETDFENQISWTTNLNDPMIRSQLGTGWRKVDKLDCETNAQYVLLDPRKIINARRFDIAFKHIYARLYLVNAAAEWRNRVYYEQAIRITQSNKELSEKDGTGKVGMDAFLASFNGLLKTISPNDIPAVPIGRNGVVMDGSHRVAAAIATERKINAVVVDVEAKNISNADYFASINDVGHIPCQDSILSEVGIEYCSIKDDCALVLIFPVVKSPKYAIDRLTEVADIVYSKRIKFTPKMGGAILKQIYLGQPWLLNDSEKSGFQYKVKSCFPFSGYLYAVLIDNFEQGKLRHMKQIIRQYYDVGNHSLHITDTWSEAIIATKCIFNENSIVAAQLGINPTKKLDRGLFKLKEYCSKNKIPLDNLCIDSGGVVDVLGIRESHDIDFLYIGKQRSWEDLPDKIECHNDTLLLPSGLTLADIVGDPNNYFWYMGVKFCTLDVVKKIKTFRGEKKDIYDVQALDSLEKTLSSSGYYNEIKYISYGVALFKVKAFWVGMKVKNKLRPLVKFIRRILK
jgi:hypothetical protein